MKDTNAKRGLASASKETRTRVAKAGGKAHHAKRGQNGTDSTIS